MSISRLALCACILLGSFVPPAAHAQAIEVTCTACLVVDDTGRQLFARRVSVTLPNASTTKMMTALVVAAETRPDEAVLVSAAAAAGGGGGLDLTEGDAYSVEALLHALLLDSSNDAAVALAEHVSGSQDAFVARMNAHARALGATDTNYMTAHGLDVPGHGSSAADLALIADRLLAERWLARIVARRRATIAGPGGALVLENRNVLLDSYPGAIGVKTGFTAQAGNVLVAAAEREGRRLIAVAMHSEDAAADSAALLDLGWDRLAATVVLPRGTEVGGLVFDAGSTPVLAAQPVRDQAHPEDVAYHFAPGHRLALPVTAGETVGRIVVTAGTTTLDVVDAVAGGPVASPGGSWARDVLARLLAAFGRFARVS